MSTGDEAPWRPEEEEPPEPVYTNLGDFVGGYLAPLIRRRLGGQLTWCTQWWRHEEAITRLTIIWTTWEYYRLEGATGLSDWLLRHADPHLAVLMSKDSGPFMACRPDRHTTLEPLPCDPAPPELLAYPAFNAGTAGDQHEAQA